MTYRMPNSAVPDLYFRALFCLPCFASFLGRKFSVWTLPETVLCLARLPAAATGCLATAAEGSGLGAVHGVEEAAAELLSGPDNNVSLPACLPAWVHRACLPFLQPALPCCLHFAAGIPCLPVWAALSMLACCGDPIKGFESSSIQPVGSEARRPVDAPPHLTHLSQHCLPPP